MGRLSLGGDDQLSGSRNNDLLGNERGEAWFSFREASKKLVDSRREDPPEGKKRERPGEMDLKSTRNRLNG